MTVARVTRIATEVLHATDNVARATRVGTEVLHATSNVARATRVGTEVLHETSNVARITRVGTEVLYTFGPPPPPDLDPSQPCDKKYSTFTYGTGVMYGGAECDPTVIFQEIDTPARDLLLIKFQTEYVVNAAYLDPLNWVFVNADTGEEHKIIKVLEPLDGSKLTSEALLVVEKHVAGVEYTITVSNLTTRVGIVLASTSINFFARDAKANSMMAITPKHYNLDAKTSTIRHIMQAISASDDLIGSK